MKAISKIGIVVALIAVLSGCASSPFAGFLATRIDTSASTGASAAGAWPCPRPGQVCVRTGPREPCACMRLSEFTLRTGLGRGL